MLTNLNETEQVDYTGKIFLGTVVANDDPLRLERVKVTIPGLYAGAVANLPWVAPKVSKGFGNKTGVGVFAVPVVGTTVYVELQEGDAHYPLYTGGPVTSKADLPEADVNYPNRYGFKDTAGNLLYVDPTPGTNTIFLKHASGTEIRINNDGSINIIAIGNITSEAPGWTHTGNVFFNGNVNVNGNVDVSGTVTADVDVFAATISLKTHIHSGAEGEFTDGPVP